MALSQEAVDDLTRRGAERGVDLRSGLQAVEDRLREVAQHELPFMAEAGRHLIDAGGKRFRPMLAMLTAQLGDLQPLDRRVVDAGVIVELVHLSTLYHDDVIDEADRRRGVQAAHVRWSNTTAILTGDFLLARASQLSAALGTEVTRIMARTIADLCAGQIREVQGSATAADHHLPPVEPDREHYLAVVGEKTASLISASCQVGAVVGHQPPQVVDALAAYGWHLGMSFQLADDVLDLVADPDDSGKVVGTDLREGVRTLPVLLALEAEGDSPELVGLLDRPDEDDVRRLLELLRDHPAIGLAMDAARMESAKARRHLASLQLPEDHAVAAGLTWLTEYAVDRDR